MSERDETARLSRRDFLTGVLVAGGAASLPAAAEEQTPPAEHPEQAQGYRESDHVRAYYASARL
jgi:hypothetical protein